MNKGKGVVELFMVALAVDEDVEGVGVGLDAEGDGVVEDAGGQKGGVGGEGADEGVEEGVAGEEVGSETQSFHFLKEVEGEEGLAGVDVSGEGGVEEGFGEGAAGVEKERVEGVGTVGGDEGDEEGLGVGEFAVEEKGREEGEKRVRGGAERRWRVGLEPVEEGEERGGVGAESLA